MLMDLCASSIVSKWTSLSDKVYLSLPFFGAQIHAHRFRWIYSNQIENFNTNDFTTNQIGWMNYIALFIFSRKRSRVFNECESPWNPNTNGSLNEHTKKDCRLKFYSAVLFPDIHIKSGDVSTYIPSQLTNISPLSLNIYFVSIHPSIHLYMCLD